MPPLPKGLTTTAKKKTNRTTKVHEHNKTITHIKHHKTASTHVRKLERAVRLTVHSTDPILARVESVIRMGSSSLFSTLCMRAFLRTSSGPIISLSRLIFLVSLNRMQPAGPLRSLQACIMNQCPEAADKYIYIINYRE